MTIIDDELQRVWALISELSAQLASNKEITASLKKQSAELRGQTTGHKGLGFSLRRFNTDITKEIFESELEKQNAALVLENHALQLENRQLSLFLKEYESTLEFVMEKFRYQAFNFQNDKLHLQRMYEQLLSQERNDLMTLHDTNVQLQHNIMRVSHAVAKQYDIEEGNLDDKSVMIELETENKVLRQLLNIATEEVNHTSEKLKI